MSPAQVEVRGVLREDGSLVLDEKPALPPGRVRVLLRAEPAPPAPAESLVEFFERVHAELEAAGHRFRTREEIDAEIADIRDGFERDAGTGGEPPQ
jgi:hypothetical protein